NQTAIRDTYTLSLHDALPISSYDLPNHIGRQLVGVQSRPQPSPGGGHRSNRASSVTTWPIELAARNSLGGRPYPGSPGLWWSMRSEEHTSELQSREKLVCRLL